MVPDRMPNRLTIRQLAKAHTFRFLTTIAAWALILAAFVYHPEWIRGSLRFMTNAIETIADQEAPRVWRPISAAGLQRAPDIGRFGKSVKFIGYRQRHVLRQRALCPDEGAMRYEYKFPWRKGPAHLGGASRSLSDERLRIPLGV